VIQPQVPLRLPCYDFTPVMNHKVVSALPKVKLPWELDSPEGGALTF